MGARKGKREKVTHCRYCGKSLAEYHWNAVQCGSEACVKAHLKDLTQRAREAAKKKGKPKKALKRKSSVKGQRRCRYCDAILKNGRRFFCDTYCQNLYAGGSRYDDEWVY